MAAAEALLRLGHVLKGASEKDWPRDPLGFTREEAQAAPETA